MADQQLAKINPLVQFNDYLERRITEYKGALPSHIPVDRFIRVIRTQAQMNPDILACDRRSLGIAIMRAAADGLLPDGVEGVIVPHGNKATWIPMVQGLLKKIRNSGQLKSISVGIVYEGQDYEHWVDENGEHFRHRITDEPTGKKIRRVYALALTKDDGHFIADLSVGEIERHRAMSRARAEDSPWKKWYEEMAKKTAIRVLSKLLPKSTDVDELMQREERAMLGIESAEERRQAQSNVTAMEQFAGSELEREVEPEVENQGESAAVESASEDGAALASAPLSAQEYFEQTEATIEEMRQHESSTEEITRWFTSLQQRRIRSSLAIPIEDVTAFHQRMFK